MYNYDKLPDEIKQEKRFVLWTNQKKPIIPKSVESKDGGIGASSVDSSTWDTYENAIKYLSIAQKQNDNDIIGIGFVLGDGFCAVDIDHYKEKSGGIYVVKEFQDKLKTYLELSKSNDGYHFLFKCNDMSFLHKNKKNGIEIYCDKRYIALTGNKEDNSMPFNSNVNKEDIEFLYNKYINDGDNNIDLLNNNITTNTNFTDTYKSTFSEEEIIKKILASKSKDKFLKYFNGVISENDNHSSLDSSLCLMLAFWCNKDKKMMDSIFRKSALYREKWDEKRGNKTYGEITLDDAIVKQTDTIANNYSPILKVLNMDIVDENGNPKLKLDLPDYAPTDRGDSELFVASCLNDVRYVKENKNIIFYNKDKNIWEFDNTDNNKLKTLYTSNFIDFYRNDFIKAYRKYNPNEASDFLLKNLKVLESTSKRNAILQQIANFDRYNVVIESNKLDNYDYLLNCPNGVVNLKNGHLYYKDDFYIDENNKHIAIKDLYSTMSAKYDYNPNAKVPTLWLKTLEQVCTDKDYQMNLDAKEDKIKYSLSEEDKQKAIKEKEEFVANHNKDVQDKINYLQLVFGYALTGETKEEVYFNFYGGGGNGKTLITNILQDILGTYSETINIESLLDTGKIKDGNSPTPDLAKLKGKRLALANEPKRDAKLEEGFVKNITGGSLITARNLHEQPITFLPKFKIIISTNYKIKIIGTDEGIWRRNVLMKFSNKFSEKRNNVDVNLESKLKKEIEGIFKWCVEGAIKYYSLVENNNGGKGLPTPDFVLDEQKRYKEEQNVFCAYFDDNVIIGEKYSTTKCYCDELWKDFSSWATLNKDGTWANKRVFLENISKVIEEKSIELSSTKINFCEKKRSNKGVYYTNLILKNSTLGKSIIDDEENNTDNTSKLTTEQKNNMNIAV